MTYLKPTLRGATSVLALTLFATSVTTAHAQIQTEEFIVTARKKEESLLDAPVAITAFSQLQLEQAGFVDIIDISKATPGLFIEDFNQTPARVNTVPRFRGVFLSTDNRLQQTATIFLDGIYMSDGAETLGINELERVEIIKGPQSALFGRNTFAGAINYVTKNPGDELRADINTTIASRGEYRIAGGVEGQVVEGLNFRLGGMFESNNGHYDNVTVPGQRLGDEQQWSINGTLFWEPTDRFRTKIRGSYRKVDDGAPAAQETAGVLFHNFGGFAENPDGTIDMSDSVVPVLAGDVRAGTRTESVFQGTIRAPDESIIGMNSGAADIALFRAAITGDSRFSDEAAVNSFKYNLLNQDEFGLKLDSFRLSADTSFDLTDNITATVLAGYNKENFGRWIDFDLTGDQSYLSYSAREIEDYTLEGRVQGSLFDEKLDWLVGVSYVDIAITQANGTSSFFGNPIVFGDIFRTVPFRTGAQTIGFFGKLDYQFTDQFSLTLEGRYQEDKVSEDDVNASLAADGLDPISPGTFPNFLPRATLRYEPTDDTTLYITYGEGNLPGGFNPEVAALNASEIAELRLFAPDADSTFGEEKLQNFEFGWKQKLFDGRAGFNLAAFYMKRSDEIVRQILGIAENDPGPNTTQTVAFNGNGATTNIFGVEIDARWQVSDNLEFLSTVAYIDATIQSFPEGAGTGDFGDIFGLAADVKGQQAPRFPPFSTSFAATWDQEIQGGLMMFDAWFARGDVFYTGNFYDSNANTTEVQDAFDSNLRFGLRGENVRLEFFVTNVFGETAPSAAFNFADLTIANRTQPGGFFDFSREGAQVALRDKRQFGLRFNYTFQ